MLTGIKRTSIAADADDFCRDLFILCYKYNILQENKQMHDRELKE